MSSVRSRESSDPTKIARTAGFGGTPGQKEKPASVRQKVGPEMAGFADCPVCELERDRNTALSWDAMESA